MLAVKWCVPDIPGALRDQIRREAYITNEIIIKQEMLRVRRAERTPTPMREDSEPCFTTNLVQYAKSSKTEQINPVFIYRGKAVTTRGSNMNSTQV